MTAIVGAFPSTLINGQVADATVVMALFSFIQAQVNSNACPKTTGSALLKGDGSGGTTAAVAGTDYLAPQPGMLFDHAGAAAPTGYLLCDGSAISRATYAALFSAIGTIWGVGDGATTFNVPDLRGRTAIGAGAGGGLTARTVGTQNIGEETHALITAELAAHNHTINVTDPSHAHVINDTGHAHNLLAGGTAVRYLTPGIAGGANYAAAAAASTADITTTQAATTGVNAAANTTGITAASVNTGSGTGHNNMQPSAVVTKIIKT